MQIFCPVKPNFDFLARKVRITGFSLKQCYVYCLADEALNGCHLFPIQVFVTRRRLQALPTLKENLFTNNAWTQNGARAPPLPLEQCSLVRTTRSIQLARLWRGWLSPGKCNPEQMSFMTRHRFYDRCNFIFVDRSVTVTWTFMVAPTGTGVNQQLIVRIFLIFKGGALITQSRSHFESGKIMHMTDAEQRYILCSSNSTKVNKPSEQARIRPQFF